MPSILIAGEGRVEEGRLKTNDSLFLTSSSVKVGLTHMHTHTHAHTHAHMHQKLTNLVKVKMKRVFRHH